MIKHITLLALVPGLACLPAASLTQVPDAGFTLAPVSGQRLPVWNGGALLTLHGLTAATPVISMLDAH